MGDCKRKMNTGKNNENNILVNVCDKLPESFSTEDVAATTGHESLEHGKEGIEVYERGDSIERG